MNLERVYTIEQDLIKYDPSLRKLSIARLLISRCNLDMSRLWFFLLCLTIPFAVIAKDNVLQKCSMDTDCVLFQDLCNEHQSILKEHLPAESFTETKNGVLFYTLESSVRPRNCLKHYFIPKSWPEYSFAKCVAQRCEVVIGKPKE